MKRLFIRTDLELDHPRATLGALAGAVVASVATGAMITALRAGGAGEEAQWAEGVLFALTIAMYAAPFWLAGIGVLGRPAWIALHRRGARGPGTALLAGAAVPALAILAPGLFFLLAGVLAATESGDPVHVDRTLIALASVVMSAGFLAIPGAAAGWTIWRIAYRRRPVQGPGDSSAGFASAPVSAADSAALERS